MIPSTKAVELVETFDNGNRKDVIVALRAMEPIQAATVAAYMRDYFTDDYHIGVFLRLLSAAC